MNEVLSAAMVESHDAALFRGNALHSVFRALEELGVGVEDAFVWGAWSAESTFQQGVEHRYVFIGAYLAGLIAGRNCNGGRIAYADIRVGFQMGVLIGRDKDNPEIDYGVDDHRRECEAIGIDPGTLGMMAEVQCEILAEVREGDKPTDKKTREMLALSGLYLGVAYAASQHAGIDHDNDIEIDGSDETADELTVADILAAARRA